MAKTIKLSKAQEKVMEQAYKDIDLARNNNYEAWVRKYIKGFTDEYIEERIRLEDRKDWYEDRKNGIVLTSCNTKTLRKLEELGLIKIIKDSTGSTWGIDIVKVLNY